MSQQITELIRIPERPAAAHKGHSGRVVLIAGSRGMSGAAVLAGLGALRGGAGLVRIYTAASVWPIIAASEPSLMVVPVAEDDLGQIDAAALRMQHGREMMAWADAIAIGPGLGRGPQTGASVRMLAKGSYARQIPAVLDADALAADPARTFQTIRRRRATAHTVVTPHPGEMAALREGAALRPKSGQDDALRVQIAAEYARASDAIVLLKGHRTVVATATHHYINTSGNAGMATGGMGDVLTGLIAALLAQGLPAFEATCLAARIHGEAGDRLAALGRPIGYLARELADELPTALAGHYGAPAQGI